MSKKKLSNLDLAKRNVKVLADKENDFFKFEHKVEYSITRNPGDDQFYWRRASGSWQGPYDSYAEAMMVAMDAMPLSARCAKAFGIKR